MSYQQNSDPINTYALRDATPTSETVLNMLSLPDATVTSTLPEAMGAGINESCASIAVLMNTKNSIGASNYNTDTAQDYSTSLDATQEYSIGELMVIAPITTTEDKSDCGIVAPHSEITNLILDDPTNASSQSSTTPTETD